MPSTNRRNFFVNNKVRNFFIFYCVFSLFIIALFLGWEVFVELIKRYAPVFENVSDYQGFPVVIKVILLLIWGMVSFILSYTYLDAKFLGIFYRMDSVFKSMMTNDQQSLTFRKEDDFCYMAESFNKMKKMFLDRIRRRQALLNQLHEKINKLPSGDAARASVDQMVQEINAELNR